MSRIWSRVACPALLGFWLASHAAFSADPEKVTGANYPLAQKFNKEFVSRNVQEVTVNPQWIGKSDQFWYSIRTPQGTTYWRVDPAKKTKEALFDIGKLASALSEITKKPLDAATLNLGRVNVTDDGKKLKFVFDEYQYEYDLALTTLTKGEKASRARPPFSPETLGRMTEEQRRRLEEIRDREQQRDEQQEQQQRREEQKDQQEKGAQPTPPANGPTGYKAVSPDKKKYLYVFKHNLYLADEGAEDKAVQLTKDAVEDYSFMSRGGGMFGQGGRRTEGGGEGGTTQTGTTQTDTAQGAGARTPAEERKTRPNVTWSPDSKSFYVSRNDSRGIKELFLVDSIATPRPKLEQYKYPMPGEEKVSKQELFYGDLAKKELILIKPKWKDERYSGMAWGKTAEELRFIRRDRLQRNLQICTINVLTGAEKCLLVESFDSAFLDSKPVRYVEETDELIWWSERSGWAHFYLYGRDGTLKNPITSGAWRASRLVDVDVKNKQIYFIGNAREPGENLYYSHLYRVHFDGTGLTLLDPSVDCSTPSTFAKVDGGLNHQSFLSPSKKYVVSTASAVDHAPVSVVYNELGMPEMLLEKTDLTQLKATGWKMPETFIVKAADGVTDLYGNLWKPFDFDPKKSYPIIANVYPGPQMEGVSYKFSAYATTMQLAQLGFIVIQVGHRGGSPDRSKAYSSFGYFNLRDYGLVDKKAAIEQLASRLPYIDLNRVGIYGHSGGGFMSAAAVLQPPYNDFFKVAVASAGNHDNNIYNDNWSERYHGLKEVPVTEEKKEGAATSEGIRGTGTGMGREGRRGRPPEEQAIEDEIEALVTGFDPDDRQSVEEVEQKLALLQNQLVQIQKETAQAKKEEAKKDDVKKTEAKTEVKKDVIKKEETKDDSKKKEAKVERKKEETKKEEAKTAEKKDDSKKTEMKKEEAKKDDTKKEEAKTPPKMKFDIKVPTNTELAANLKGHLLLVHGEIDNNVHPANTMRLADALIKANKRFELLIIPGSRHAFGPAQPYFTQKMWDYFAEFLLDDRQTRANIYEKDVKRR